MSGPAEEPRAAPRCPFCGSREGEVISLFGTQAITLQYRCHGCGSYYEALKYAAGEAASSDAPPPRSGA
ncbi:MAG: hypothetical protein E6I70_00080 [Chloroflexi bacterium]|nr:MAG: hypothetical protein E6I63_12785 [Chloroflexota bacterium]TME21090.1 MAG: hypothetical protein E6I70_00080 [Chloroflexota bacterium]